MCFLKSLKRKQDEKKRVLCGTANEDKVLNLSLLLIFRQSCVPWLHMFSYRAKHNQLCILHCHEHFLFSSKAVQRNWVGESQLYVHIHAHLCFDCTLNVASCYVYSSKNLGLVILFSHFCVVAMSLSLEKSSCFSLNTGVWEMKWRRMVLSNQGQQCV